MMYQKRWKAAAVTNSLFSSIVSCYISSFVDPLSAIFTKWSNTFKQFVGNLPTNCLSVFGQFVGLAIKGLKGLKFIKI